MHPDLERLSRIDAIDRERRRLSARVEAETTAHREATEAVERAERALRDLQQQRQAGVDEERELSRKLHRYRDRRTSALRVLESGQGDPDAAQRQLDQCDAIIDETETAVLELLERQDALSGSLEAAEAALSATRDHLEALANALPATLEGLRAELAEREDERQRELAALDASTADRYERLVARRGTAVARVEGGACSACRRVIQAQHLADLRRGLIQPCHSCNRWLIPEA